MVALGLATPTFACEQVLIGPSPADSGDCAPTPSSQDLAHRAVAEGRIVPLSDALAAFTAGWPGEIVQVELEDHDGRLVYEARILGADGRRREITIDGKTLQAIEEE